MINKSKILIIEDDSDIREGIRILLESESFEVIEVDTGEKGITVLDDSFSLVILDVMLPGISGIKTCEEIRKNSVVPVLFLTAKSNESDKLIGLMVGGDDYLVKPFSYAELLGRVKALLRRYQVYSKTELKQEIEIENVISIGNISINCKSNEVIVDGKAVNLTDLEYRILLLLMQNPRKVFSAQSLYESIWQDEYYYSSNSTVMVHISNIRSKIEAKPEEPKHIVTVWGRGYRFE